MFSISPKEKTQLINLIQKLDQFKQEIENCDYTHERERFFNIMADFRKFCASIDDVRLCEIFFRSKNYKKYENFFRPHNYYYMRALESTEAIAIMTKQIGGKTHMAEIFDRDYMKNRYIHKAKELQSLDMTHAKHAVLVGCGPLPETILYLYENTQLESITGLDYNQEAVYMAEEMIYSMGLSRIQFEHTNGAQYNYEKQDIVYIAGFVHPKKDVLNQIVRTGKDSVQILVDSPTEMQKMLFDDIPKELHPRLDIVDKRVSTSSYYRQNMLKLIKLNH